MEIEFIRKVYESCNDLLHIAPPKGDDKYEPIYTEVEKLMDTIDSIIGEGDDGTI